MENKKLQDSLFKIESRATKIESDFYLFANISSNIPLPPPKNKNILIVLDKSGSMEGENMDQCKSVIKLLLRFFKEKLNSASISLITFDVEAVLVKDVHLMDIKKSEKMIDAIEANKSTAFTIVLKRIQDFIENRDFMRDLTIIFMTDGDIVIKQEKENNFKRINDAIANLRSALDIQTEECDIHAIGLGKEHDPFFLEKILQIRPFNSTYLFIIDQTGIEPAFNGCKDMIYENNIRAALMLYDKENNVSEIKLNLREIEVEQGRQWELFQKIDIDIDRVDFENTFVKIYTPNQTIVFNHRLQKDKNEGKEDLSFKLNMKLIKIKVDLEDILHHLREKNKIKMVEMKFLDQISEAKNNLKKEYNQIFPQIFKIKEEQQRKNLFNLFEELAPLANVLEDLIAAGYKSYVKNDLLAKAVQLSHKNIKKKKYIRELNLRIKDTVKLFNEQDKKIQGISSQFNSEILYMKYEPIIKDFTCFLTCYDFVEALTDQDCLCITFDLSRKENAIVSPTSIKINAIYPTIISAKSFINALKYSINLNFDQNAENKEQIIKGISQESINAAFPIFLCKEHWEIAKIYCDRILGWIITLDPTGYHFSQKLTFPFILLEFCILECVKNNGSEFNLKYFRLILETCINILIDESEKGKDEINKLINQWVSYSNDGTQRLPEIINKNSSFFIKIYCLIILGHIKPEHVKIDENYYFLIEEELRRTQLKKFNKIEEFNAINLNNEELQEKEKILEENVSFIEKTYLNDFYIFRIIKFLMLNCPGIEHISFKQIYLNSKRSDILKELGLNSEESLFALYFQNQIHDDNAIRKKSFLSANYVDCRSEYKKVFELYSQLYLEKVGKKNKIKQFNFDNKLRKGFRNLEVIEYLIQIRKTEDLHEAEELLLKALAIKPGKAVDYFLNIFNGEEVANIYRKMKLLKQHHSNFRIIKKKWYHTYIYKMTHLELVELFGENYDK